MENRRVLKTGIAYLAVTVALLLVRILFDSGVLWALSDNESDALFTVLAQIVCMGLVPFAFFVLSGKKSFKQEAVALFRHCRYKWKLPAGIWLTVILFAIVQICFNSWVSSAWQNFLSLIGYTSSSGPGTIYPNVWSLILALFMTAFLPAVFEEFTHRGFLLRGLERENPFWAIVISSLLFALMHQNITQTLYTFMGGLFFGYVAYTTGSILPAMLMHFANNAWAVLSSYLVQKGSGLSDIQSSFSSFTATAAGIAVSVVIVIVVLAVTAFCVLDLWKFNKRRLLRMRIKEDEKELFPSEKTKRSHYIPLIAAGVLGVVTTLYTLVWGLWR